MKRLLILALAGLAACSSSPKELEQKAGASRSEKMFSENYQEVYRRLVNVANSCQSGTVGPYASMQIDSQLYNELGFGEVSMSVKNFGTSNYFWTAKIEKTGAGSKLTVTAGNSLNQKSGLDKVLGWASGKEAC